MSSASNENLPVLESEATEHNENEEPFQEPLPNRHKKGL